MKTIPFAIAGIVLSVLSIASLKTYAKREGWANLGPAPSAMDGAAYGITSWSVQE